MENLPVQEEKIAAPEWSKRRDEFVWANNWHEMSLFGGSQERKEWEDEKNA